MTRQRTWTRPDTSTSLSVLVVLLFGLLDWVTHHELVPTLIGTSVAAAGLLLGPHLFARLLGGRRPRLPHWARPLVAVVPGFGYLLLRGPSSAPNLAVTGALMAFALLLFFAGRRIDRRLSRYYAVRNRVPVPLRLLVAPAFGLVLGYTLVHGSLGGLSQLWRSSAERTGAPGPSLVPVIVAAMIGAVSALLLLRDPAE